MANYDMTHKCSQNHNFKEYVRIWGNNCDCYQEKICGSAGTEPACNAGDLGLIPGLGRSPGEGNSYPLHYSGLEISMDCIVHGVTKSQTRLSDFYFH